MKKLACLFLIFATVLLSASCTAKTKEINKTEAVSGLLSQTEGDNTFDLSGNGQDLVSSGGYNLKTDRDNGEMRGIWISYGELSTAFDGDFKNEVAVMFDNIKDLGLNTVFVHARAFCDAFYPSKLFPWSAYITGTEGVSPGFDPLKIMVDEAKKRGLEIHAWLNPYRISYKTEDVSTLANSSYIKQYMTKKPSSTLAVAYDGGLYLNPANADAEKLIIDGVKEILDAYDVDGIHFDDYVYPNMDSCFDQSDYLAYVNGKSNPLPLADWRRENVNRMLKSVYTTVKSYGNDIAFGVSPAGNNERNYNELYADTDAWVNGGYIDYIIPQIYFGYSYSPDRFSYGSLVNQWAKYSGKTALYVGLGAYKIGAGADSEKADWESGGLLEKQIKDLRSLKYDGFVVFSYSSLFSNDPLNTSEREKISQLIGAE